MCTVQKWDFIYLFDHTAKWIKDSSIFSSIKPKIDIGLFVFTCFYQFLHYVIIILFCRSKQNNFMITSWKTGENRKNTKINKQSDVKFWLNWIKLGDVSYLLSLYLLPEFWKEQIKLSTILENTWKNGVIKKSL